MSRKWREKLRRLLKPVVALAAIAAAGGAFAQAAPWSFAGSDTLEHVMRNSIDAARAAGVLGSVGLRCSSHPAVTCTTDADCRPPVCATCNPLEICKQTSELFYAGGGSGTAETAMGAASGGNQCLGPMSRNFRPATMTAHPTWGPDLRNVLGLDAAVAVQAGNLRNLQIPTDAIDSTKAAANLSSAYTLLGTAGFSQILEVALAGVDGSGSVAACSDPRRINAVYQLAQAIGAQSGLSHIYRRDDNSGTTDTVKEKLAITRFCNGAARGVLGTISTTNPNLNNQDLDPIRRPCTDPALNGWRATTCTNLSTGAFCTAADNAPGCEADNSCACTQGLVVALSIGDNDGELADATKTIGARVNADPTAFGYAGREAVRQVGFTASGPTINTNPPEDSVVRLNGYMLSRRLFLQFASTAVGGGTCGNTLANVGGAARVTAEQSLYDWMTGPTGRFNVDPIMRSLGYIPCLDDPFADINQEPFNLCQGPYAGIASTPGACVPTASAGGPAWGYGPTACTAGQICCSTGTACPASLVCPAATGRPLDAACTSNGECASNNCSTALLALIGNGVCQP